MNRKYIFSLLPVLLAVSLSSSYAGSVNESSSWEYHRGQDVVYRVNSDEDVQCFSYDGNRCEWGHNKESLDFSRVVPLTCGRNHAEQWGGSLGYGTSGHWCNEIWQQSLTKTWTHHKSFRLFYRHNEWGQAECLAYGNNSNDCIRYWEAEGDGGNSDQIVKRFFPILWEDENKVLTCGSDHSSKWSGDDGYSSRHSWCSQLSKPWAYRSH